MSFVVRNIAADAYFDGSVPEWTGDFKSATQFNTHNGATTMITQLATIVPYPEDLVVREVDTIAMPADDTSWWKRLFE